ncbi:prepilin peptidase [Candidatus Woesearchaeota archaeon]|nr:prepilin peptidase [Candidatus Woesearchaeota archaeon]
MVWELLVVVALASLIAASINDLRTREVPDWVSYAGIAAGLGIRLIDAIVYSDIFIFGSGVLGFAVAWVLGVALFYTGQWGGGDSKVLMALGALLGGDWDVLGFQASLLMNLIVVGGMYGLVWMTVLGTRHFRKVKTMACIVRKEERTAGVAAILGILFCVIVAVVLWDSWYWFPALWAAVLVALTYGLYIGLMAVERVCFFSWVPATHLVEGDWIVQDVKVRGEYICGRRDLGVSREQIALLRKAGVKKVLVRSGIPFVPSFLLALIATLSMGNVLVWVLL